MAWNEPGNSNNDKDPWTGKQKAPSNSSPELNEFIKRLQQRLERNIKSNKGSGSGNGDGTGKKPSFASFNMTGVAIFLVALVIMWALSGIFIVQPAEKAVVLYFGKYDRTMGPGVHWLPRFYGSEQTVNVQQIYSIDYPNNNDAMMLTKDENIVDVAVTVKYIINNPYNYLYKVVDPVASLNQATASALRQVIGSHSFDDIITTGRDQVRAQVMQQLNNIIQKYNMGIQVMDVTLKSAKAPEQVKAAFDDAIKAREDEQRYINQAQAYAMQVVPIAGGQAQRQIEAAKAYAKQVVLQAQANTASFEALLPAYIKAPQITRERIYLDAMDQIMSHTNKIIVNGSNSNNLLYLPLQQLMQATETAPANSVSNTVNTNIPAAAQTTTTTKNSAQTNNQTNSSNRPQRNQTDNGYGQGGPYE